MSPREPIFADRRAEGCASITTLIETEHRLQTQLGAGNRFIADAAVERFGAMLRAEILSENADLRRSYMGMLVGMVSVNDNEIAGYGRARSCRGQSRYAGKTAVRGCDGKWCPEEDFTVGTKNGGFLRFSERASERLY